MRVIIKPGAVLALGFLIALTMGGIAWLNSSGKGKPEAANQMSPAVPSPEKPTVETAPETASAPEKVESSTPGNLLKPQGWNFYTEQEGRGTYTELSGTDLPAQPAYRFDTESIGKQPWNVGFNHKLVGQSFAAGTPLRVTFHARSPKSSLLTVLMQKDAAPYPHCWKEYVRLTPEWKSYTYDFKSAAYADGEAILALFLGAELGVIEVAGLTLEQIP
ncbi:MAG: hypothetical protein OHK0029_33960 [Armatimonadaceae bacterium]